MGSSRLIVPRGQLPGERQRRPQFQNNIPSRPGRRNGATEGGRGERRRIAELPARGRENNVEALNDGPRTQASPTATETRQWGPRRGARIQMRRARAYVRAREICFAFGPRAEVSAS